MLIPAIDLLRSVREVVSGRLREIASLTTTQLMLLHFVEQEPTGWYIVDLDGADGRVGQPAIEAIMRGAGAGSDWWWVADRSSVAELLDLGCATVILGTVAVEQLSW